MVVSALYRTLEELHAGARWGRVLDAGTGTSSLKWLSELPTERWDAVTGAESMAAQIRAAGIRVREVDRLIVGNWEDPTLLAGERYDVVIADYLLGAVEGFAPYFQDQLFPRLRELVGGRLYLIGLEPYVPYLPTDMSGQVVSAIGRLRDACLLLAGERPYREYPLSWVRRQLEQCGMRVVQERRFPIRFGPAFIQGQLNMAKARAERLSDRAFADALLTHIERTRGEAMALCERRGGLRSGEDYVVWAEPR
ncbi:MAG: class I SAM-dependent methyltransferase [Polyangiaceae bacterium]|nr:class I SAM-dependent methyltransferase [Polyangiaceae bacterium]MCW5792360.1 class I SAM-dependent methyltransferase [Polyangiaceae bacterium]